MSFDVELLELMPHVVQWRAKTGASLRGVATTAAPTPITCYYDDRTTEVADFDGRTVNAIGTVYCGGVFRVGQEDSIEVPDGSRHKPVQIQQLSDDDGPYATVVSLGA